MFSTDLSWLEALLIVLFSMRHQKAKDTHLSPHELLTGRPMPGPPRDLNVVPDTALLHTEITEYMTMLTNMTQLLSAQVQAAAHRRGDSEGKEPTGLAVGNWVWVKNTKCKWPEPPWMGPYQVTEASDRAVGVQKEGETVWHHYAHCSKTVPSTRILNELRENLIN